MSSSSSEPDVAHPARTYHADNPSVMGDETTFGRGATKLLSNLSRRTHKQRVPGDSCTITGWRLILITIAMMLGFLFTEMDRQWFDTAIPRVTSEFHSLDQAAWYQTAYDLPRLAALPIYGRVYTLFPLKITYCVNVLIFLLGSFVCGFAPNSHTLIIGRAIQGWGNAGMNSGAFIIICLIASRIRMPLFLATIVLMGSVAAAAGPPLGGIFAESTYTWRLGFRLNIALVAFNGTLIAFALREPERLVATNSLKDRLKALDPRGASLILGSMTCLTLALQWGGSDIAWSDSKVIGCFIGFGLMMVLFLYLQVKEGDEALIPVHILTQRTVGFACLSSVFTVMAFSVVSRFMPFYFQAVRGLSPRASGVYILALAIPDPLVAFGIAALVTLTGYYIPFIMACGGMLAVGSGLLSTLQVHTDMARVIGYELLMAISLGLGVQLPLSAVRNVLVKADVPTGNALVLFSMSMGSVLAVPISQTIFMNVLRHHLQTRLSPGEVREIIRLGPSGVQPDILGPDLVPFVAESYNAAIVTAFRLAIATATMALFAAASMEWKRLGDDDAIVLVARGSSELPIVPERPASGEIQLEESISFSHVEEVVSGDGAIHCRCREQEKGCSLV